MINVHLWQPNSWEGYDDGTEKPVFVDGPYSTSAAAKTSASQLQGTEDEAAGGLYAVSAALTSHLGATVNAVAQCLSTTSGHGNL